MPKRRTVWRGIGILTLAFLITSTVMFWLPVLSSKMGYDVYDYGSGDYSPDSYDFYPYADGLKNSASDADRVMIDSLLEILKQKTDTELVTMTTYDENLCSNGRLNCYGLAPTRAIKAIETVLRDRQLNRDVISAERMHITNLLSGGSFFTALVALLIGFLTYRDKRRQAALGQGTD